jgi:nitrite reductase/ring-hydroxylating ferredoxin subunit
MTEPTPIPSQTEAREVEATGDDTPRRSFLTTTSGAIMTAALVGGYGLFGTMLLRFVMPAAKSRRGWLFVCQADALPRGDALDFIAPSGTKIVVAHHSAGETDQDFLALSSVCPHLGCRVHWEAAEDRFFCPCHNGAFSRDGSPIAGPPKAANQSLVRFPLKVEKGLIFLELPLESLAGVSIAADSISGEQGVV